MKPIIFIIATILVSGPAAADSGGLQCSEVAKGDALACKARVKSTCTQEKYWDRRKCEDEIASKVDQCHNGAYEAACKAASTIAEDCSTSKFSVSGKTLEQMFAAEFIERYNRVNESAAAYAKFHKEWSACYPVTVRGCGASAETAKECQSAAADYHKLFAKEVDDLLSNGYLDKARAAQGSADELGNADYFAGEVRRQAKVLLGVNAKLRAELRYKEAELNKLIAGADKIDADEAARRAKEVENRRCPRGTPANGAFRKLVETEVRKVKGQTLTAVPVTGAAARSVDNGTLVTRESIPAYVCVVDTSDGKRTCSAQSISFYREKAPASPWTSWAIAWGSLAEVSCKK
jgi:hypothetical protein